MALQWCMLKKLYYYGTYKKNIKKIPFYRIEYRYILEYHSITIEYLTFFVRMVHVQKT